MESTLRAAAGAPDLMLIETLGWNGAAFARLDLHLARLVRSATMLDWPCGDAAAALHAAVPANAARVRLTLDAFGKFDVTVAQMPAPIPVWRLGLAKARLKSADPWLTLKSTNRSAYDAARANLPVGVDEVIFQNESGQVCDGTITTLFFDRGNGLRTPPLQCGLLPGVLRAEMNVPEEVLMVEDLPNLRLWVGNSLRGLAPAIWGTKPQ